MSATFREQNLRMNSNSVPQVEESAVPVGRPAVTGHSSAIAAALTALLMAAILWLLLTGTLDGQELTAGVQVAVVLDVALVYGVLATLLGVGLLLFTNPVGSSVIARALALEWNRGRLRVDADGRTSEPWLWSAGDWVNGPDVVHAVADGHRTAASIHAALTGKEQTT
jgi:hypothetical protein